MRGDRPERGESMNRYWQFTPHARGSTHDFDTLAVVGTVYPACAGIDPPEGQNQNHLRSLPRMRGDRPVMATSCSLFRMFTPHARGSTVGGLFEFRAHVVYPACAGIDHSGHGSGWGRKRLPRMRGDRPHSVNVFKRLPAFTPHARGSTEQHRAFQRELIVYPACAGIDPYTRLTGRLEHGLPRMRGDRPNISPISTFDQRFTPHARGSTNLVRSKNLRKGVYPACAGIDPLAGKDRITRPCLPRMRGDRPLLLFVSPHILQFTPHARGSTWLCGVRALPTLVYPACAGIDRYFPIPPSRSRRLPRMRGDRPRTPYAIRHTPPFTPHARGSTCSSTTSTSSKTVYPACAGIDPGANLSGTAKVGLPRMRGDRPALFVLCTGS